MLPETVLDRSVPIRLKKKGKEKKERWTRKIKGKYAPRLKVIQDKLERWASTSTCTNIETDEVFPDLYSELDDRAFDCWEPLLMIANEALGEWYSWAVASARKLSSNRDEKISYGVQCLIDCKDFYLLPDNKDRIVLPSGKLLDYLFNLDTSPWSEYKGKGLTHRGLSSLLKKYGITPDQHRDDPNSPQYRGYLVADFQDAWTRYLPDTKLSVTPVTPVTTDRETGSGTEGVVTVVTDVTVCVTDL